MGNTLPAACRFNNKISDYFGILGLLQVGQYKVGDFSPKGRVGKTSPTF
jgi:hypothetical protein